MQQLGERFREPVGESLHHDRLVVVVFGFELGTQLVGAFAGRDAEATEVVGHGLIGATKSASDSVGASSLDARCWRNIGKRSVSLAARLVFEHDDVVAVRIRRPEAPHAARLERAIVERSGRAARSTVVEQLARRRTLLGVVEDLRDSAPSAPTLRRRTSSR